MKRLLLLAAPIFMAAPAYAGGITNTITDSVQLTVEGAAVQTTRMGASYSVSGSNVSGTLGGAAGAGSGFAVVTDGQAFSFDEGFTAADTPVTNQVSLGANTRFDAPVLYGESVTQIGGEAGTMSGTLSNTGVGTVTPGGPGTTATAQRSVELSVF